MPLTVAPMGREVMIKRTMFDDKVKKHMENLGILAGQMITPVSENKGSIIIQVKGSRLAIDKSTAMKIMVN